MGRDALAALQDLLNCPDPTKRLPSFSLLIS